jgi:hypothetical protein
MKVLYRMIWGRVVRRGQRNIFCRYANSMVEKLVPSHQPAKFCNEVDRYPTLTCCAVFMTAQIDMAPAPKEDGCGGSNGAAPSNGSVQPNLEGPRRQKCLPRGSFQANGASLVEASELEVKSAGEARRSGGQQNAN